MPKGALLFILEPVGPKTPAKFRNDGIGDATHMGIVTGRGDGAIHSSSSRGCVATSKFKGKTIPNGGWNRIGMLDVFSYGVEGTAGTSGTATLVPHSCNKSNRPLVPPSQAAGAEEAAEEERITGRVVAETGLTVNLRKKPGGALIERIPVGTEVDILDYGEEWCKVRIGKSEGYMKTEFLVTDDREGNSEFRVQNSELSDQQDEECFVLLAEVYEALRELCERIEEKIGKG